MPRTIALLLLISLMLWVIMFGGWKLIQEWMIR